MLWRTWCVVLSLAVLQAADGKRSITETDLYSFQWIADARISPDGARIAYTHVSVNPKHDGYETELWIIPSSGGAPRQLTAGPRDSAARWSPDGKTIAFLRGGGEREGKPGPAQIYLLPLDGGEARQLTDLPKGAGAALWSPDGRWIACTSTTQPKDFDKKSDKEDESDVRVITKAAYRQNGAGYNEPARPSHIWKVEVPEIVNAAQKAKQITTGEFTESDPVWSRDGATLYYTTERIIETYYDPPHNEIYSVSANGGAGTKVTGIDGGARGLALSANGRYLTFTGAINKGEGVIERSYSQPDLFVTSVEAGSTAKNLTEKYDFDIGGGVGGDQGAPRGGAPSKPFWSKDGRFIFVVAAEEGRANLKRVEVETGKVEALTSGDHDVFSYDATPDGSKVAVLVSTPTNIGDLYVADGRSGKMERLTHINEKLFSQLNLTEPAAIWYKSFDGKRVETWVQRPPDFQEGKKYPMILDIHGGPHSAYGYTFDHEFQWMAAKGYVVLYP
ncbi:MAG TPA: hypothetical protein VKG25_24865, partial [Bryobacteraceae bacterium]|nr:hypothetical protein [Bryobacteraceae bacterium]